MGVFAGPAFPLTTNVTGMWVTFAAFAVLLLALMAAFDTARKEPVLQQTYQTIR